MKDYVYFQVALLPKGIRIGLDEDETFHTMYCENAWILEGGCYAFVGDGSDTKIQPDDILIPCPMKYNKQIYSTSGNVVGGRYPDDWNNKSVEWFYAKEDIWLILPSMLPIHKYTMRQHAHNMFMAPIDYDVSQIGWEYILHGEHSFSDDIQWIIKHSAEQLKDLRDDFRKRKKPKQSKTFVWDPDWRKPKKDWSRSQNSNCVLVTGSVWQYDYQYGQLISTMDGDDYDDPIWGLDGPLTLTLPEKDNGKSD